MFLAGSQKNESSMYFKGWFKFRCTECYSPMGHRNLNHPVYVTSLSTFINFMRDITKFLVLFVIFSLYSISLRSEKQRHQTFKTRFVVKPASLYYNVLCLLYRDIRLSETYWVYTNFDSYLSQPQRRWANVEIFINVVDVRILSIKPHVLVPVKNFLVTVFTFNIDAEYFTRFIDDYQLFNWYVSVL